MRGMLLASSVMLAPFGVASSRADNFREAAQEITAPAGDAGKNVAALAAGYSKVLAEDTSLAKRIADDEMACAATVDGALVPLVVAEDDPRIKRMRETYALAGALPHFREQNEAANTRGTRLIDCQSGKLTDNLLGNYWYLRDFATYYRREDPFLEALAKFHEREHRMRNQYFPYSVLNAELPYGEDIAHNELIDEANAYTRDLTAAYVMRLRGKPEYWNALQRESLKNNIIKAANLYDPQALKDYAAGSGFLPPLLMRHVFVLVVQDFVNEEYYRPSQKRALEKKPKGNSIDDVFVIRSTSYDGYNYLHRTAGVAGYMRAHSPISHRMRGITYEKAIDAIRAAREEGADYTRVVTRFSELANSRRKRHDGDASTYLLEALQRAKKTGELNHPFVVSDLIAFTRHYSDMIERRRDTFPPEVLAGRRQSVHDVMRILQAERKQLCGSRPSARAAANLACG